MATEKNKREIPYRFIRKGHYFQNTSPCTMWANYYYHSLILYFRAISSRFGSKFSSERYVGLMPLILSVTGDEASRNK
jgi:hypothetical protein